MKRVLIFTGVAAVAIGLSAAPAVAGLAGNPSFSHQIPVRVPSGATTAQLADDHGDDNRPTGGPSTPASIQSTTDDRHGSPSPTDGDRPGSPTASEPGDDHGHDGSPSATATPSDHRGSPTTSGEPEPGDDHGQDATQASTVADDEHHRGRGGSDSPTSTDSSGRSGHDG